MNRKYEFYPDTERHVWSVVDERGGLHLWIQRAYYDHSYFGGFEGHYREPPEYRADTPPDNERCWLLDTPCWHDGSSLWAEEYWIPLWQETDGNHDGIFVRMVHEMDKRFGKLVPAIAEAEGGQ